LGYSLKFIFFFVKKKTKAIIIKRPAIWKKLAEEGSRYTLKNQARVLDKI
jgi:hypothetical protein